MYLQSTQKPQPQLKEHIVEENLIPCVLCDQGKLDLLYFYFPNFFLDEIPCSL